MLDEYSPAQKISAGLVLFSIGISSGLYIYSKTRSPQPHIKVTNIPQETAQAKLTDVLKEHYPDCYKDMLAIYDAAGLMPLLTHAITTQPSSDTLSILNTTLQSILLRPRNMERHQLEDEQYLHDMQNRLQTAYKKAGLTITPKIDSEKLRTLLSKPNL